MTVACLSASFRPLEESGFFGSVREMQKCKMRCRKGDLIDRSRSPREKVRKRAKVFRDHWHLGKCAGFDGLVG